MYIEDLRWHVCDAGWRNWVFVEVETSTGLIGVGEATTEGREATIVGHLDDLSRTVVGSNPLEIEALVLRLTRDPFWVGGYVAATGLAAVEIALWDILGRHVGQPVWQLLGGKVRERVPVYANGWYFGADRVEEWVERAGEVVELGYRALKFDPFGRADLTPDQDELDRAYDVIGSIRAALGPKIQLFIEGHGRFSVPSAIRIARRLAEWDCGFFEEPIPPGNPDALRHVTEAAPLPIAVGERYHSRLEARRLLETGAVHILQPDVVHDGGILETRKIAALAETWFVPIAPHNPNGPVATAATLTVDAVTPNVMIQEMLAPWDVAWRHDVVRGCPKVVDGHLAVPSGPGLGVELDVDEVRRHQAAPLDPAFWSEGSVLESVDLRTT